MPRAFNLRCVCVCAERLEREAGTGQWPRGATALEPRALPPIEGESSNTPQAGKLGGESLCQYRT